METPTSPPSTEVWCGWCRDHPDKAADLRFNAITYCHFIGGSGREAMVYIGPGNPLEPQKPSPMHFHDLVITTDDQLTVKSAVERWWRPKRYRIVRTAQIAKDPRFVACVSAGVAFGITRRAVRRGVNL